MSLCDYFFYFFNFSLYDVELKKKWLYAEEGRKERIICVIDDRQKVVDMWRNEGLICLQAYAWEEYKK